MEIDESHDILKKVINSIPGHVYWKDINGKYLGCNKQQAKALCLESPSDIIGKTDHDLAWSADANLTAILRTPLSVNYPTNSTSLGTL